MNDKSYLPSAIGNPIDDFGSNVIPPPPKMRGQEEPATVSTRAPGKSLSVNISVDRWMYRSETAFSPCATTAFKLPGGMYCLTQFEDSTWGVSQTPINVDELLDFPDSLNESILNEIKNFWTKVKEFKYYGFLHRRGYMFYGPHGSGKSCLVQQIIKNIITNDGLVVVCDKPSGLNVVLKMIRAIEPDRHIVCLFEDLDSIIRKHGESEILSILDGENQIDSVLNIATTNYPEVLDKRLVSRPRRFDRVIKIDWPNPKVRRFYFKHKLKIEDKELDRWVDESDRFSFAACAELVISVKCLGKPFEEALDTIRKLTTAKPDSKDFDIGQGPVGFGRNK